MKLTIAIPTYNRSFFLDKNLKELLNQYNSNFEIIVQDNASTDNTTDIIDKYIKLGLPIIYEKNKKNLGWAKNFEICFKKVKTKYMILLGSDDIIFSGGIEYILKEIELYKPDLIFMNAIGIKNYNKKNPVNYIGSNQYNLELFLKKTILQFRLISSYVINTDYINEIENYSGNFAHLHVIFKILNKGNIFIKINGYLIGSYKDNSDFNHEVNFSDIYVKEFFLLFKKNLLKKISELTMSEIESIMLKLYLPKLIIKSRLGLIKSDNVICENFDLIFQNNVYYKANRSFYIKNNIFYNFILITLFIFNSLKNKFTK
jgi:glycosyltransferase involved in cell wall biosynthesis